MERTFRHGRGHFMRSTVLACVAVFAFGRSVVGMPKLDEPVPLPAEFDDIVTIYPDNANPTAFWVLPSTARIVKAPNGNLAFGLVHSGISSFDPDGLSALLTVTVQPYVDVQTLSKAKALVAQQVPGASFSFVTPTEMTCRMMVGGQYVDWNGAEHSVVKGGSVEAGIPFQFKTNDNLDVRALSQAGGGNANTIGALYTMKYRGVVKRLHFELVADYEQALTHFKSEVKGSAWFGAVKAHASAEWTDFKEKPFVEVVLHSGTQEQFEDYMEKYGAKKLLDSLLDQLANRTGYFTRTVKPTTLPGAPGGGGLLGWGVSAGGGFEESTSTTNLKYVVNINATVEREVAFGMTFPTSSTDLKPYVKNLTDTSKPFPTGADYLAQASQHAKCRTSNLRALKKLYDEGLLPLEVYIMAVNDAWKKGCHVKWEASHALLLDKEQPGSLVSPEVLTDFVRMRVQDSP